MTLRTLGFRIPAEHLNSLLGQVSVYPWDASFADAWKRLPRTSRWGKAPAVPPYRQLLTGLTAVHSRPVRVVDEWALSQQDKNDGHKGMIVTSEQIDPFHLTTCVRTFERLLRAGEDRNTVAPFLPTADLTRRFADYVSAGDSGTVTAPGWVFDSATWAVMARLASSSFRLEDNGPTLPLRMDTEASVLAWNDPISNIWGQRTGHAMLRLSAKIITQPRDPDLFIIFDAHLSRFNTEWRGAKNTWIDREDQSLPVMRVPVRHVPPPDDESPWTTVVANHAAAIARSCGLEGLDLKQDLPEAPGAVRPLIAGPQMHPVGRGPGARVMLRLAEHIEATCPELEPLQWIRRRETKIPAPYRQTLKDPGHTPEEKKVAEVTPDLIARNAQAAGHGRTRLICLYSTSEVRERMTTQLNAFAAGAAPTQDDQISEVGEGLAISIHHRPQMLKHGRHDRTALIADLGNHLKGESGPLLAWVETEFDPHAGKPADDAKRPLRQLLAGIGITSQFISAPPPEPEVDPDTPDAPKIKKRRPKKAAAQNGASTDHAARSGAADLLLRAAGILHPKVTSDLLQDFLQGTPHRHVHLVGVHCRLQHSGTEGTPPKLVITAAAIRAHLDPEMPWTVTFWSDAAQNWIPQPKGIADFHHRPIGSSEHGRRGEKSAATRIHTEAMLDALPPGPVVVFVDAVAARTIWPGLQNSNFALGALPGTNLSAQRDVSVVRCNTSNEVPRPVNRQGGKQPADTRQPAAPDRYVYQLGDTATWLFPKSSRVYRSKGGRLGATYTPWTLPEELHYKVQDDWHSYTGTEITVPQTGPWKEVSIVTLTARLSDHTITWDDRTLDPMPLHLATRADLTHPDYRTDEDTSL
jgi:hypothetical protein